LFHQYHANHLSGLFGNQGRRSFQNRLQTKRKRLPGHQEVSLADNQDNFRDRPSPDSCYPHLPHVDHLVFHLRLERQTNILRELLDPYPYYCLNLGPDRHQFLS
jgi:hypothetical protein